MGVLDELRVKADHLREAEQERAAEHRENEQYYEVSLQPVMQRALGYFSELVENLRMVAPDIKLSYPLDPRSDVEVELVQGSYSYDFDHRESPRQLVIGCVCTMADPIEFYLGTKDAADNHAELLDRMDFHYHRKNKRNSLHDVCGATFILEGPLLTTIHIIADMENRCIKVVLRNVESQSFKQYRFPPEEFDEQLQERLAQMLLRQVDTLVEVELCENYREALRQKVARESRLNEVDLANAFEEKEAREKAESEARLLNRAKRQVAQFTSSVKKRVTGSPSSS